MDDGERDGLVPTSDFLVKLRSFFPVKSNEDFAELKAIVLRDLQTADGDVNTIKLAKQDSTSEQQSHFVEALREQYLTECERFKQELSTLFDRLLQEQKGETPSSHGFSPGRGSAGMLTKAKIEAAIRAGTTFLAFRCPGVLNAS